MDTCSPTAVCYPATIRLATRRPNDFVDLTDRVHRLVVDAGLGTGLVNVQTTHTTTAVVVNENEPLLIRDLDDLLERLVPRGRAYRHDDLGRRPDVPAGEPRNGHAHGKALLLPATVCLNVIGGRLVLGRWQRVFLVDLDGPREREVTLVATGVAR